MLNFPKVKKAYIVQVLWDLEKYNYEEKKWKRNNNFLFVRVQYIINNKVLLYFWFSTYAICFQMVLNKCFILVLKVS